MDEENENEFPNDEGKKRPRGGQQKPASFLHPERQLSKELIDELKIQNITPYEYLDGLNNNDPRMVNIQKNAQLRTRRAARNLAESPPQNIIQWADEWNLSSRQAQTAVDTARRIIRDQSQKWLPTYPLTTEEDSLGYRIWIHVKTLRQQNSSGPYNLHIGKTRTTKRQIYLTALQQIWDKAKQRLNLPPGADIDSISHMVLETARGQKIILVDYGAHIPADKDIERALATRRSRREE